MQKALWAYALGVVCHFALDASCHTYINHFEKTRRISHHEIEKEFALRKAMNLVPVVPYVSKQPHRKVRTKRVGYVSF